MARGLKVGDFVYHKSGNDEFYGVVAEVEENGAVAVNACSIKRSTVHLNEHWLKKLTTPDVSSRYPYREGDTVKIIDEESDFKGKEVYVYQVTRGVKDNPDVLGCYLVEGKKLIHMILLDKDVSPVP